MRAPDRTAFHRIFGNTVPTPDAPHYYSFDYQGYHFVALDSQQPGAPGGYLDPAQLTWLRQGLDAHRDQPTLVFVHHHPWPLGLAWIDAMQLHNGEELMRLLETYPAVRWVICGHVHTDQVMQRERTTVAVAHPQHARQAGVRWWKNDHATNDPLQLGQPCGGAYGLQRRFWHGAWGGSRWAAAHRQR
jgi:3',5'-cyclic AMP phosphodiesterase CpdA